MRQHWDRAVVGRRVHPLRPGATGPAAALAVLLLGTGVTAGLAGCSSNAPISSAGVVELGASSGGSTSPTDPPAPGAPSDSTPADASPTDGGTSAAPRPTTAPAPAAHTTVTGAASPVARTPLSSVAAARSAAAARAASVRASASRSVAAAKSALALLTVDGNAAAGAAAAAGPVLLLGSGTESVAEAAVVKLVNVRRAAAGCPAVAVQPTLVQLARAHSQDMSGTGGFKHNGSDGRTPFQRMMAAGYDYSVAAENIAAGQPNAATVMAAWMASPGHQANILDCRFTQIGVGVINRPGTEYIVYWTQEFGTPM